MSENSELPSNANEYSSHREQLEKAQPSGERRLAIEEAMQSALGNHIYIKKVQIIRFSELNVDELAAAFHNFPILIKPITSCVNVAQRASARDLKVDIDTYALRLPKDKAYALAGYLMPLLPAEIEIPALIELDRYFWVDKEMRAKKGNWEKNVSEALERYSGKIFKKVKFIWEGEKFEIDCASFEGESTLAAFDAKRIESHRDIHKRSDEILNKAVKLKLAFPNCKFYAIIYYPFPDQHINLQSRLRSDLIDGVFFAGETASSIDNAAQMAISHLGWLLNDPS